MGEVRIVTRIRPGRAEGGGGVGYHGGWGVGVRGGVGEPGGWGSGGASANREPTS